MIARFTISYQRKQAPLSKAVLERRTGLRGPAVLEALPGLVRKGLVEKRQGAQYRPNLLGLILPDDWEDPTKPGKKEVTTRVEKTTSPGVGNPTYFKMKDI